MLYASNSFHVIDNDTSILPRKVIINNRLFITYTEAEDSIILESMIMNKYYEHEIKRRIELEDKLYNQIDELEKLISKYMLINKHQEEIMNIKDSNINTLNDELKREKRKKISNKIIMWILVIISAGLLIGLIIKK